MKKILAFLILVSTYLYAQEELGIGLGIYPTGTETGVGIRSSKNTSFFWESRISKASYITKPSTGILTHELNFLYRVKNYEKVRLHLGLGIRSEINLKKNESSYGGIVVPIGVEAFPFPFQNGGLFFEIAPTLTTNLIRTQIGIRTASGFLLYLSKSKKNEKI